MTLALAAAVGAFGGGCGGDDEPVRPSGGRVDMVLDDFFLEPQRIRARPGRLEFRATNRGRIGHTLRVVRGERELVTIRTLKPGESGRDAATFERGEYKLVCVLGNHDVLGMYGILAVR
jgi:hypothetical protein